MRLGLFSPQFRPRSLKERSWQAGSSEKDPFQRIPAHLTSLQPPQRDHSAWHRSRGTRASPRVGAYADTQTHGPQTHTVLLSDTDRHSQMYKAHTSRNRGTDTNSIHMRTYSEKARPDRPTTHLQREPLLSTVHSQQSLT